jgi:hypothetical protein
MNWQRATERDQARRAQGEGSAPAKSSFKARYAGTCVTCGQQFDVGDLIASTLDSGKRVFSHKACVYGTRRKSSKSTGAAAGPVPNGRCHAITKKGEPCRGGAKKGELYCGPHLDQMDHRAKPSVAKTTGVDPYDEPF